MEDPEFYIKEIYAVGLETMKKIKNLKIFLHGLRGIGIEIAKNLILSGPSSLTITDNTTVTIKDLGTNPFLTFEHINTTTRAKASISKLQQLNPSIPITIFEGTLDEAFINQFNIICLTESDSNTIIKINNYCRVQNPSIGFISCEN